MQERSNQTTDQSVGRVGRLPIVLLAAVLALALAACEIAPPTTGDGQVPTTPETPSPSEPQTDDDPTSEPEETASESEGDGASEPADDAPAGEEGTLRATVAGTGIDVGTAVPVGPLLSESDFAAEAARQFSSVTAENEMKPDALHPSRDTYDFATADSLMEWAQTNDMKVRGHTLVWHAQNPGWLTAGGFSDDELREILRDHVTQIVSHFEGQIYEWDVANEVLDEQGQLRSESPWAQLGEEYLDIAFEAARAADPNAKLFINDFNIDGINTKSDAYYDMVQGMLERGVPIDGIGFQAHLSTDFAPEMTENLQRFKDLGLEVAVTELDVGAPAGQEQAQAEVFGNVAQSCVTVGCSSFTMWGFTDRHTWRGDDNATVMTEDLQPKPAFETLLQTLSG
jgi:endo-1,4-beta-xylanase